MKLKALFTLTLCLPIFLFAQNNINSDSRTILDSTPFKIVDTFFMKANIDKNWSMSIKYISEFMAPTISKVQVLNIGDAIKTHKSEWGEYYGYEFITSRRINNSIIAINYMALFKNTPIKFTFIFYKADKQWLVTEFKLDAELNEELLEFLKFYLLDKEPIK